VVVEGYLDVIRRPRRPESARSSPRSDGAHCDQLGCSSVFRRR
jgi:hypothetical protein